MASGSLRLVVGLGNPGEKYQATRHNAGFWVVDRLAARMRTAYASSKFKAEIAEFQRGTGRALLVKPQTFMNLSGESIQPLAHFYKVELSQILIISDDLDLPAAALRLRKSGGAGGHNGLKSVIEALGGDTFPRLRIGIGRSPTLPGDQYVLAKMAASDWAQMEPAIERACEAVECWMDSGMDVAMNRFNQKGKLDES